MMSNIELHHAELQILKEEWSGGALHNPFWLINECVVNTKSQSRSLNEIAEDVCGEVAEVFLECTSYRGFGIENVKDGEKNFMTAMFLYLYLEAPPEEQNLSMICELVRADVNDNGFGQTNLERLFKLLEGKDGEHPALKLYGDYRNNSAGRAQIVASLSRRLCPLFSFKQSDEDSIFCDCGSDEVFEMAIALLHNCWDVPQSCNSLETQTNEIAFMAAVLHLMHDVFPKDEQTMEILFKHLKDPRKFNTQIENASSPTEAVKYWRLCRDNILSGTYDKKRVSGAEKFFKEFK